MNYGDGETWGNLTPAAKAWLIAADPLLADAIAEEREACARIADEVKIRAGYRDDRRGFSAANEILALIRERGK